MLQKLDVVEILVKDWPVAIQWYTEKLGLQIHDRDDEQQWCRLLFPQGGSALALWGRSPENRGDQYVPIILVDDLEATVKELAGRGVEFKEKIRRGSIRDGKAFLITTLVDCEDNELQLIDYLAR